MNSPAGVSSTRAVDQSRRRGISRRIVTATRALPLEHAHQAFDLDTVALLLGMMIVVANLRLSGLFALANAWAIRKARRPITLRLSG